MADEINQDQDANESSLADLSQATEESDFDTGADNSATQDSLAINRARAAYGKKSSNTIRERRTPQRVVTSDYVNEDPYEADDIDDDTLIAPEKGVINKTYKSSLDLKEQKVYTNIAESSTGNDILALQSADSRVGQTISFKVKGIQWKAGYSNEFTKTPLGHTMHPIPLPSPTEDRPDALKKTGIVIRPVNPKLQKVLNQLLPSSFKKEMNKEKAKRERLKQISIFYLPSTQSASVGFIHEFIVPRTDGRNAFFLYIQTSVGKAPVAILDEVLRTLEAGLPEGEKADVFDYTIQEEEDVVMPEPDYKIAEEVNEAMKQVSNTLNDSIVVHSVKQGVTNARNVAVDFMRQFDKYLARAVRVLAAIVLLFMNSWPMKIFINTIRFFTKWVVKTIWGLNKVTLAVARSPSTIKALGALGKFFSLVGGLLGAVFSGVGFFAKVIGKFIVAIYTAIAGLFRGKLDLNFSDLGISLPGSKNLFGDDNDKSQKKAPVKITGKKAKGVAKPQAKPQAKSSTVTVQTQSKLRQVTKPVPPKVKGAASLQQVTTGGGASNSPVGSANSSRTPGNSPLGYFEDEPF
jgi:hypothetical protein